MERRIDLATYNSADVRVYAGRDRGEAVRKLAQLDEADATGDSVLVLVPDDLLSMNSSFFLGMFGDSIRNLGGETFRERYRFEGANIEMVLEDGIAEAMRRSSPLAATGEHRKVS